MPVSFTETRPSASSFQVVPLGAPHFSRQRRCARNLSGPVLSATPVAGTPGVVWNEEQATELLALVKRMAIRMRDHLPAHVEVNDLVGAGVLGLLDALRKFDASKQVKLESYARHRIRGAILDGLRSLDGASRDLRKKAKRLERVHYELTAKLGRPAAGPDMASVLGMSLQKWYRTVQDLQLAGAEWLTPFGSAHSVTSKDETCLPSLDEDALTRCCRLEQKEILLRARARLPERERRILEFYYDQEMTMKQIAERLGIDESRISQLHGAAVARLRTRVKAMLRPAPPARAGTLAHAEAACGASVSRPEIRV